MEPRPDPQRRIEAWRKLDSQGVPRTEIARRYGVSRATVSSSLGRRKTADGKAKPKFTIYATRPLWDKAAEVALKFGLTVRAGKGAGRGSPASLLEAIGAGDLVVLRRSRVRELEQAARDAKRRVEVHADSEA